MGAGCLPPMKLSFLPAVVVVTACSSGPAFVASEAGPSDGGASTDATPTGDATADVDQACATGYPQGPYGTAAGQVLDPAFTWQGYAANETTVSTLTMADLFDCDGSKGIDAVIIDNSAGWCAACEAQAHDEASLTSQYDQLGIRAITLLIMDASEAPATTATALDWRTTYGLMDVGIYADPSFLLEPQNQMTIGLPVTMIVDPRTMQVATVLEGYASAYPLAPNPTAVSIAMKNRAN